jgi:hypothetical protein
MKIGNVEFNEIYASSLSFNEFEREFKHCFGSDIIDVYNKIKKENDGIDSGNRAENKKGAKLFKSTKDI